MCVVGLSIVAPVLSKMKMLTLSYEGFTFCIQKMRLVVLSILVPVSSKTKMTTQSYEGCNKRCASLCSALWHRFQRARKWPRRFHMFGWRRSPDSFQISLSVWFAFRLTNGLTDGRHQSRLMTGITPRRNSSREYLGSTWGWIRTHIVSETLGS